MKIARICSPLFLVACLLMNAPVSAELVGYWPLSEGSGDTTADASGKGNDGTITNGGTGGLGGGSVWMTGFNSKLGREETFMGFSGAAEGAFVQAGEIPVMTLEQDFTWAFFANHPASNTQPNNVVFGNRKDADAQDFDPRQFIKFTPTKFEWHMNGNGNDNMEYEDFSLIADEWYHHAVVKDGADLTYYRDGIEMSTMTITQALDNPQPLFFGGDNEAADGENYEGMLDELRVYDHALTQAEVASLVPEPSSLVLLALGLLVFVPRRFR